MALTSGFFNSHDKDRRYTAAQLSELFTGLITDGIYRTVGTCFAATLSSSLSPAGNPIMLIGAGRGYFDGYWVKNDNQMAYEITSLAPNIGNRWDAIVLEVDSREFGLRSIDLNLIPGPASEGNPAYPSMDTGIEGLYRHPLCYILREEGTGKEIQNDGKHLISAVGNDTLGEGQYTPFVSGLLQSVSVGDIWTQWNYTIEQKMIQLEDAISGITIGTIPPGSVGTDAIQNGSVNRNKLAADQKHFVFKDVPITKDMFDETNEFEDYPYRGHVYLGPDILESMVPHVTFSIPQIAFDIFASASNAYNGGVYIYASDLDDIGAGIQIPTIELFGGVS